MSEPPSEAFYSLLRSDLCTSTDAFISVYRDGISRSPNPVEALTRFTVGPMAINKEILKLLQHELLSFKVDDNQSNHEYEFDFFIERNGAKPQALPASTDPLVSSLASVSIASTSAAGSTALVSTAAFESVANCQSSRRQTPTPSEVHPLLPLNETLTSSVSSTPTSESSVSPIPTSSVSYLPHSMQSNESRLSFREKATLGSARVLHSSAGSLMSVAEDRILGRGLFVTDGQGGQKGGVPLREIGQIVRQIWPNGLSFYELGLLVDVVHKEAPDYHVLKEQCYWFVTTICIIIVLLYGDKLNPEKPTAKPPKDYLPNMAGRWKNVLVVAPEDELIRRITIKFMERRHEAFSEVHSHQFSFVLF
jgi:hypothetical protein